MARSARPAKRIAQQYASSEGAPTLKDLHRQPPDLSWAKTSCDLANAFAAYIDLLTRKSGVRCELAKGDAQLFLSTYQLALSRAIDQSGRATVYECAHSAFANANWGTRSVSSAQMRIASTIRRKLDLAFLDATGGRDLVLMTRARTRRKNAFGSNSSTSVS